MHNCLSFCRFSLDHGYICPLIYSYWLLLWFTSTGYYFDLQVLVTTLIYSYWLLLWVTLLVTTLSYSYWLLLWSFQNPYVGKCLFLYFSFRVWILVMVFNATFNNMSAILWRSVLLVEETRGPGESHRPAASHGQTLSHNVVSSRSQQNSRADLG